MMAKVTCSSLALLLVFAAAVRGHRDDPERRRNHNLDEVEEDIEELEVARQELYHRLNNITNTVDVAQRLAAHLKQCLIARQDVINQGQTATIHMLQDQANALHKRVCDIRARAERAEDIANTTQHQINDLSPEIQNMDNQLGQIDSHAQSFGSQLSSQLDEATDSLDEEFDHKTYNLTVLGSNLTNVENVVKDRRCDYGTFMSAVPGDGTEPLYSDFDTPPHIAYSIIGFVSHIVDDDKHDSYSYGVVDLMGFNVSIHDVTTESFDYTITEIEDETIEPKELFIRYMACENLDYDGNPLVHELNE